MAEAGVKVTYKDEGLKELFKTLADLKGKNVVVGIRGKDATKKYDNGATVGLVAKAMEFGTRTIPKRPFLQQTVIRYADDIGEEAASEFSQKNFLTQPEQALEEVGRTAASFIVAAINGANSWARPNLLATVQSKGSQHPLVDTGKLRDSISWAVRDGRTVLKEGKA